MSLERDEKWSNRSGIASAYRERRHLGGMPAGSRRSQCNLISSRSRRVIYCSRIGAICRLPLLRISRLEVSGRHRVVARGLREPRPKSAESCFPRIRRNRPSPSVCRRRLAPPHKQQAPREARVTGQTMDVCSARALNSVSVQRIHFSAASDYSPGFRRNPRSIVNHRIGPEYNGAD